MDVRCEKCQTEYELDEARLKPTGVTVKCTHCGHMFKIRKRSTTNVGAPAVDPSAPPPAARVRPASSKQPVVPAPAAPPAASRATSDSELGVGDDTVQMAVDRERNWLIRLENGEQKQCRELASLQQWIVAGIVTRDSLISRSGKTWKRLGDIGELAQYFVVAEEAKHTRSHKPTNEPPTKQVQRPPTTPAQQIAQDDARATMIGLGAHVPVKTSASAGGTILPDDDDINSTGSFGASGRQQPPPSMPPPPGAKTPPMGVKAGMTKPPPTPAARSTTPPPGSLKPVSVNATMNMPMGQPARPAAPTPPPPAPTMLSDDPSLAKTMAPTAAVMAPPAPAAPVVPSSGTSGPIASAGLPAVPPSGNRATAMWASDQIKPSESGSMEARGPSGPTGGRLGAIPSEPAFAGGGSFAGRVRAEPTDSSIFGADASKKIKASIDDGDDDVMPQRRGSRAGLVIAIMSLLVIGGAVAVVWLFVLNNDKDTPGTKTQPVATGSGDAGVAQHADASAPIVTPLVDAAIDKTDPLAPARSELAGDVEPRLKTALDGLNGKDDAPSQAIRARLSAQLSQDLVDRAGLVADKAEADKLRKDAKQLLVDALPLAQHAVKGAADSADANLAMADVLRLQGKSAGDVQKYLDKAKGRDADLIAALVLQRDKKLDDARTALAALDSGDSKMEASGDVRARYHLALIALAQDKPTDAKPLVDQILAAQPEHAGARALSAKLETLVAKTDPLPVEEHRDAGVPAQRPDAGTGPGPSEPVASGNYDVLMQQANKAAETNCGRAMELYQKALDLKPSSVEALTGQGICHLDAKQFQGAYSKFRAALALAPRYEPALGGIAEMYQLQGNKDRAIEAWKAYLEVFPGSAKGQKHLEQLGAGTAPTPPTPGSDAPPPTPPPTPPTPPPTPPEAPAGSDGT